MDIWSNSIQLFTILFSNPNSSSVWSNAIEIDMRRYSQIHPHTIYHFTFSIPSTNHHRTHQIYSHQPQQPSSEQIYLIF